MLDLISDTFYSFKRGMNKFTTGFFLIFSLIGVAALIYSFVLRAEEKEFFANCEHVTGSITNFEVHETKDSDGNVKKEQWVYVSYEVNGTNYDDIYLCNYESGMHEGAPVEVYYNPSDPTDVKSYYDVDSYYNDIAGVAIFFIVAGALPMIFTVVAGRGKYKNRGLLETGRYTLATVKSIEANYHKRVNGEHPYWIICEEENKLDGVTYTYTSHVVYEDLTRRITPGDQVAVYVNPENPELYYVNLDEIV